MSSEVTASVVIPTYNRRDHLRTCLTHLAAQTRHPVEVVVVDASPEDGTRTLVADEFPWVTYLRNDRGAGSTATSRAIGVRASTGEVLAFLDDDAYAEPDWLEELLAPYADASVGGVGGRALNGQPGEEEEGRGQIGMFLPNGTLTGNFAADPGRVIEVDHMLGANMSLRRSALEGVGGIRDTYPGTCLREETDPALRLKRAGWLLLYTPAAVVRHVAGPYAKGRRFDLRYVYYGQRNHVVLLAATGCDTELRRYLPWAVGQARREVISGVRRAVRESEGVTATARSLASGGVRGGAVLTGVGVGLVRGARARSLERQRGRSITGRDRAAGAAA